ncbi:kinase-like domain-containing protein [Rhizophagus irregularis DAOM 181602=DAOM 197198]|nr:kinase-like domain-containing protein [Rhizophagus irregularis DAOM 181602=DAOM 197198]
MELVKLNDENSFDPTPKLKSSSVPIFFVSFDERDNNCFHCGEEYTRTIIYGQKYCKKCLSCYLNNITAINIHLVVYLFAKDSECTDYHEIIRTKVPPNIQECCLIILFFKQIISHYQLFDNTLDDLYDKVFEDEKYCKLCGKLSYQETDHKFIIKFKLCSSCYLISSGCIESTFTEKFISIIYLPFWDNTSRCYCDKKLVFTSNCQNGDSVLDDFLINIRYDQLKIAKFANDLKNINKYFIPSEIYNNFFRHDQKWVKYIPYSQLTNVKKIAEGGFSIIYQATWIYDLKNNNNSIVILKRFKNLQYAKKYFLKELESNYCCYKLGSYVNETFGFTKDPKLDDYTLISILHNISTGLMNVHEDTPECYANLMKSCWDPDPKKRPSISEIWDTCSLWYNHYRSVSIISSSDYIIQFAQAELKRKDLIVSKKLGSKFSEKPHPKAIYTSRSLNSYISKCSSIFSKYSSINFSSNDYTSNDLEFDIDIKSELNVIGTKRNIEELNNNSCENNRKRIKIN